MFVVATGLEIDVVVDLIVEIVAAVDVDAEVVAVAVVVVVAAAVAAAVDVQRVFAREQKKATSENMKRRQAHCLVEIKSDVAAFWNFNHQCIGKFGDCLLLLRSLF
uniref:Uncharacterized protein n=1 Tax=Tetranychus urticae TaxID=32264 RepID=T1KCK0_TETUR